MNDKQSAELNMFQAVKDVLAENKSKYVSIPILNSAVTELDGNIGAIREASKERSDLIVPAATSEKQLVESRMINQALKVARVANVYAFDTGNPQLLMQTNATKSTFYHLHGNQKLTLAKSILDAVNPLLESLIAYGLHRLELDSLDISIAEYVTVIAKPRGTINERKGQTSNLTQLFAHTKSLLNDRLDKMMSLFKDADPDFYTAYFNARNIINTAYRKRKME